MRISVIIRLVLICVFLGMTGLIATSQEVYSTVEGDLVIKFPDGTEREVVPSDSILYRSAFENIKKMEPPAESEPEFTEREEDDFFQTDDRPREMNTDMAIWRASNLKVIFSDSLTSLKAEKVTLEEELEYARSNPGRIRPSDRVELSSRYNFVVEEIRVVENRIHQLREELASLKRSEHRDILARLSTSEVVRLDQSYFFQTERKWSPPEPMRSPTKKDEEKDHPSWVAPEHIPMPIIPHPSSVPQAGLQTTIPERVCNLKWHYAEDEIYEVQTQAEQLTFYLPPEMRIHRRGRPMITVYSSIISQPSGKFIVFDIHLMIPSARVSMGGIEKDSPIRIQLIDGEIVNLRSLNQDRGHFNQQENKVVYRVLAPLNKKNVDKLLHMEADRIRFVWDSGFADYEIYDINLIRTHLNCLIEQDKKYP